MTEVKRFGIMGQWGKKQTREMPSGLVLQHWNLIFQTPVYSSGLIHWLVFIWWQQTPNCIQQLNYKSRKKIKAKNKPCLPYDFFFTACQSFICEDKKIKSSSCRINRITQNTPTRCRYKSPGSPFKTVFLLLRTAKTYTQVCSLQGLCSNLTAEHWRNICFMLTARFSLVQSHNKNTCFQKIKN